MLNQPQEKIVWVWNYITFSTNKTDIYQILYWIITCCIIKTYQDYITGLFMAFSIAVLSLHGYNRYYVKI